MPGRAILGPDGPAGGCILPGQPDTRISTFEAVMAGMDTRGRRHHVPDAIDFRFVAGAAMVAIAAILLSLTLGVPVPPAALMLIGP
jgi:hypothetical protein